MAVCLTMAMVALVFLTGGASATPVEISTCDDIGVSGETYVLTDDIVDTSYSGDCIEITASDVILDGQGHMINASGTHPDAAIWLNGQHGGATNVTIRNVTLVGWNTGIDLTGNAQASISNVTADRVDTGVAVGLFTGATVTITDSTFTNTGLYGIQVVENSEATIRNVTIVSEADGMLLAGSVVVEDSDISTTDPSGAGITITDVSAYQSPFDATIQNNTISAGYRAVSISEGVNATVVDNTLVGDGDANGLVLDYSWSGNDGPVNALVDGNDISDVDNGVVVQVDNRTGSLADVTVTNNDIRNASVAVLVNEDQNSEFQTWIADAKLTYDVSHNTVENATKGVYVQGTSGTISGNWFNITYYGVQLNNSTAALSGNDIRSSLDAGTYLQNGAIVTIDGDRYHDSPKGVSASDSDVVATDVTVENVSWTAYIATNSTIVVDGGTVSNTARAYTSSARFGVWADVTVTGATLTDVDRVGEADFGELTVRDTTVVVANDSSLETFFAQAGNLTLDGVTVEQAGDAGFSTAVSGSYGSNVTVTDSAFDDAENAVLLENATATVANNEIRNASDHAINATNATVTIVDNVVYNSSVNEIRIHDGAIDLINSTGTVARNEIDSNRDGINAYESNVSVSENNVTAILYSVNFRNSAGTIANNTVDDGMYVRNSYNDVPRSVLIEGNAIHNDGYSAGVSLAWNVRATVRNNTITTNRHGIRTFLVRGADIVGNSITIDSTSYEANAGIFFEESPTSPDSIEAEDIAIVANEFFGSTGVRLGDQYGQDSNPYRDYVIMANDFSATETPVYNMNETVFSVPLNYYGPRGPTDHEFVGAVDDVEPFLTKHPGDLDDLALTDVQSFAYSLDFEPGRMYAFGTPATLEANLSETFGDFEGAIYTYDESNDSWELATGEETLGAMDAVVVIPTTDTTAVVDFADATPSYPENREIVEGWNFVAPRHYDRPQGAFSTQTTSLTDLLELYWQPDGQPMYSGHSFGHYTFPADSGGDIGYGPRVSPFGGYFVYATEPGTIPGSVPNGVTAMKIEQLLGEQEYY